MAVERILSTVWFARCEVHEIASTRIRSARFGGFGSQRRGAGSWIRRSRTRSRAPRVRSPRSPREPVRRELIAILLSAGASQALEQLDRSGIASKLAPGATPGSGAVVDRMACDLELRLAGWLRGTHVRTVLQRLRFSRHTIDRVELLLRFHHSDNQINAMTPAAVARFAHRVGAHNLGALIALRESRDRNDQR